MRVPLLLALVLLGCQAKDSTQGSGSGALAAIMARGRLIVGIEPGFEPFEGIDAKGEYYGFDIELARAYANDLDVAIEFVPMEWTALQVALSTGQIDIIWSGMTATVSRSVTLLFSDTYFRTRLHLLVRKDSGIKTWSDVAGKKIAVKLGTTGVQVANLMYPDSPQVTFDDENLCATEVINGRVAAFLYDRFSIERHHRQNESTTDVIRDLDSFEPYAVAMRPGSMALWRSINLFLERTRYDGRYAAIHQKYFGEPPAEPH